MEAKYKLFWESVLDYNYKKQKEAGIELNVIKVLCANTEPVLTYADCNNYMMNKKNYNLLRKNLIIANINFKRANAHNLTNSFDKEYDVIMLSNILDYAEGLWGLQWPYGCLKDYEESIEKLSSDNGVVFLSYIFDLNTKDNYLIDDSSVLESDLTDEVLLKFPNANRDVRSGMILKRIKK